MSTDPRKNDPRQNKPSQEEPDGRKRRKSIITMVIIALVFTLLLYAIQLYADFSGGIDISIGIAQILGIEIDPEGAEEIACRSRGTPRIANRLLKRARDFAEVVGNGVITKADADLALSRMEIDPLGLDNIDRMLLTAMVRNYNGGPVGLDTIAAAIGEDATTIEDVYEPYLMQIGFLSRTPRGRMVTPAGYRHLGLPMPGSANQADDDQLTL